MPTFEITGPDGARYRIDGDNEQGALAALQQHLGGNAPQSPDDERRAAISGKGFSQPSRLHSALAGFYDALTFGGGDEASAAVQSALGVRPYDEALSRNREANKILSADNPGSFISGQVAGSVLPAVAIGGGNLPATLGGKVLTGAGTGAAMGGLYGFNAGEGGVANRVFSSGQGAFTGAALGAAVPVIGSAIGSGVRAIQAMRAPAADKIAARTGESRAAANISAAASTIGGDFDAINRLLASDPCEILAALSPVAPIHPLRFDA